MSSIIDIDKIKEQLDIKKENLEKCALEANSEFNFAFIIENLCIYDFCKKCNGFSVFSDKDKKIIEGVLLSFYKKEENHDSTPLLFKSTTVLPFVRDSEITVQTHSDTGKLMDEGIIIDQYKEPFGLLIYIPFRGGKKVYGFYRKPEIDDEYGSYKKIKQFISISQCKEADMIPNMQIPDINYRSLTDPINEDDKILAANSSPRFRKMSENWLQLSDALLDLNDLLNKTIDPNYIEKIMLLNNQLSFPTFS